MSLDDPGLDTVPVDSNSDDHREARRPAQVDSNVVAADQRSQAQQPTPDELIALAEQEASDRRIRAALADNGGAAAPSSPPAAPAPQSAAPAAQNSRTDVRKPRKRKARKLRRIVRRVDAWSVLKVSLLFFFCVYLIGMVAGVLLWNAAQQAGTIEGFEGFIADLGAYETFRFEGEQIFNGALIGGLVLVIAGWPRAVCCWRCSST